MCRRFVVPVLLLLIACDPDAVLDDSGEEAGEPAAGEVTAAVAWDVSPPLRELAPYDEGLPTPAAIGAPGLSVSGIGQGFVGPAGNYSVSVSPADPNGDIGPNHYVQVAGTSLAIFNRSGSAIYGPIAVNALWAGFPGQCGITNDEDHSVRYDRMADRWVITQFSVETTPFYQCVAVSTTPDPTGSYFRYQFQYSDFNDYPRLAIWPDAYYVSYNMFNSSGTAFLGGKVCALDRARMLSGQAATQQCFNTSTSYGALLVSDVESSSHLPPAGSPAYALSLGVSNNDLAFWRFHVDWTNPANSTFVGPSTITVASYTPACITTGCAVQPATTNKLEVLGDRLMGRLAYRHFDDHEALIAIHDVLASTGTGGIRWYELRNPGAGTPTVFQQGTYAPASGTWRWMGSAGVDRAGGIALGFSLSSSAIFPSLAYTGRLPADAPGTMGQGEANLVSGSGSQTGGLARWGDWSAMGVDPLDDCTFWFTGEYQATNGQFNWRTRIGNFMLPNCVAADNPPGTAITSPASGAMVAGTVTIQATASDDLGVTSVDFLIDGVLIGSDAAAPYSIDWDTTAAVDGFHALTTVAHDTGGHATTSTAVIVTIDNPGGADLTAPVTAIARPLAGATIAGTVKVAAKATDLEGVTRVDLYQGATLLGSAAVAPYSILWDTTSVPDGSYSLTSRAYDAAGNEGVSAPVNVTVRNNVVTSSRILNGGFETSLGHWAQVGPVARDTSLYKAGVASARIGSTSPYDGDASIAQSFNVPATGVTTLRFWYQLRCDEDSITYDQQEVLLLDPFGGGIRATLMRSCDTVTTWTQMVVDLTPYAGQTITLMFLDHDDGYPGDPTWMYIDAVSVKNVY